MIIVLPRDSYAKRGLAIAIVSVRPSVRSSVCLSVRLSVKHMLGDKTNKHSANILMPHEKPFYLLLGVPRAVGGGPSFYLKFWAKVTQRTSKDTSLLAVLYSVWCADALQGPALRRRAVCRREPGTYLKRSVYFQ